MHAPSHIPIAKQLKDIPTAVRPTVRTARAMVRAAAPKAMEVPYRSSAPRSKSAMWKLLRYVADGEPVIGIGTYPSYATLFFYRGRELDDGTGLLEGGGKDARFIRLQAPADAERAAVKRLVRKAFKLAAGR
jgi:hypothetical protein